MFGVTERGPDGVPILITSYGEYRRWFGGALRLPDFSNAAGPHCFLPHAVEGFFTNGGKRVYVSRVTHSAASRASTVLFDPSVAVAFSTWLLGPEAEGSSAITVASDGAIAPGMWLRIDSGFDTEYREVLSSAPFVNYAPLVSALGNAYDPAAPVEHHDPAGINFSVRQIELVDDLQVGANQITIIDSAGPALTAGTVLALGAGAGEDEEFVVLSGAAIVDPAPQTVQIDSRIQFEHGAGATAIDVTDIGAGTVTNPTTAVERTAPDDGIVFITSPTGFTNPDHIARISDGTRSEVRRVGQFGEISLDTPAYTDYHNTSIVDEVAVADVGAALELTLDAQQFSNTIFLDDRSALTMAPLPPVLRIGTASPEYVAVADIPEPRAAAGNPDPGPVVLGAALRQAFPANTQVFEQSITPAAPRLITGLAFPAPGGSGNLHISNVPALAAATANSVIRVEVAPGTVFFHGVGGPPTALAPFTVNLVTGLRTSHASGAAVVARAPMLEVRALDTGGWGNRLRVSVEEPDSPVLRTTLRQVVDPTHIRLESSSGVEMGTLLEYDDGAGTTTLTKVQSIDRQSGFLITLGTALPGAASPGDAIRTIEFNLNVNLLRQPDPAIPSRSNDVLISETFPHLSLDHRHSRYIEKVVGATWTFPNDDDDGIIPRPLRRVDRRSEGESALFRINDFAPDALATETLMRATPELLTITLPNGETEPLSRPLLGGNDQINSISDTEYIGNRSDDPDVRTGLQSLRNIDEISIVACPGRTSARLQGELIAHCELMKYRFAVLDGPQPPGDTLSDAQFQRQQHDTKYAALYHPWLLISHPFPDSISDIPDYPVPPSGHTCGVYARTDIERGVHKSPANEVVRGITGLQRILNKGEQDILNPSPVNINVIRDFRPNNRGLRVYGGRVITSDPDWKYVNVRRLVLFIEQSLDNGLQWITFEPNSEPLWARVRRSIESFLTVVWRNGALEGTKPEEAFFVKCDRTTMTQADIDNGKLICIVGVAPTKPAEFAIIRLGLWTSDAS
jgi:hypothetical protein